MPVTPDYDPTPSGDDRDANTTGRHLPLYRRGTNEVIGHLGEPVHIKDLQPGAVVWHEVTEQEAVFEGWFPSAGCYLLYWPSLGEDNGEFCAWDLDGSGRPHMWRHVFIHERPHTATDPEVSAVDSTGPGPGQAAGTAQAEPAP